MPRPRPGQGAAERQHTQRHGQQQPRQPWAQQSRIDHAPHIKHLFPDGQHRFAVADDEHRRPGPCARHDGLQDPGFHGRIEVRRRLVEQEYAMRPNRARARGRVAAADPVTGRPLRGLSPCPVRRAARPAPRRNPRRGRRCRGRQASRTARGCRGCCRVPTRDAERAMPPEPTTPVDPGRRRQCRRSGRRLGCNPRMACSSVVLPTPLGPVNTVDQTRFDAGAQRTDMDRRALRRHGARARSRRVQRAE